MQEIDTSETLILGSAKINKDDVYTPSKIQADTLFTFISELRFLIAYLKKSAISPRFCNEVECFEINKNLIRLIGSYQIFLHIYYLKYSQIYH